MCKSLATVIRPFLTSGAPVHGIQSCPKSHRGPLHLAGWRMGAGCLVQLYSMSPQRRDRLAALRSKWFKRLSDTQHCFQITAALLPGCKESPMSQQDLVPYLEDMLDILDCPPGDFLLLLLANHSGCSCGTAWLHFWVIQMQAFCCNCPMAFRWGSMNL